MKYTRANDVAPFKLSGFFLVDCEWITKKIEFFRVYETEGGRERHILRCQRRLLHNLGFFPDMSHRRTAREGSHCRRAHIRFDHTHFGLISIKGKIIKRFLGRVCTKS